ncbi:hypothetical protein [Stenotrophomonas maltophilia]|uniref:hypothetical protein n=1 Tax=Stenotrophomonas maltophilia TaxID=40324 RepID=UPI002B1D6BB5|nr:hypothetical protein [Stenotrophomonas maltophilia]
MAKRPNLINETIVRASLADVQSGGRVRLGDALPPLPKAGYVTGGDFGHEAHNAFTPEQMRDYALAALSAQPSPGGQGALAEAILRMADHYEKQADIAGRTVNEAAWLGQITHELRMLAARQPVGEPPMEMRICELRHVSLKPNRPYVFTIDANCANCRADAAYTMGHTDTRPAQAVDLGAVRALLQRRIEQWRSHLPADPGAPGTREIETKGEHDYNNDVRIYREGIAVMEEVLSKIGGQAVGNG